MPQNESELNFSDKSRVRREVSIFTLRSAGETAEIKQLNGKDHLVIPSIILVEGVLHASNAVQPAMALATEFGIFPQSWDGRPVVYNHPKANGEAVSANSPNAWNSEVIGQLFGSSLSGSNKLRTNLWLDKDKTPDAILQVLEEGGTLEVSTGLYALEEESSGSFNGKKYEVVWRNIVPDHLAILSPGTLGACNNEDGCGAPRANMAKIQVDEIKENACGCQSDEKDLPKETKLMSVPTSVLSQGKSVFKKTLDGFLNALGLKSNDLSDYDRRMAAETALHEIESGVFYVVAVYTNKVIYTLLDSDSYQWSTLERSYSVSDGSKIVLGNEVIKVRPETQYVPLVVTTETALTVNQEENIMTIDETTLPAPVALVAPVAVAVAPIASAAETPEVREAVLYVAARRATLIKALAGKNDFTEEDLKNTSISVLEKLAKAVNPEARDFSGAAPVINSSTEVVESFTAPMKVFAASN